MRVSAHAMAIDPAACTDTTHMGAGVNTVITHAGAGADHMTDMTARVNPVPANARTCADTAHMGAGAHAILAADMHARTNTQHIDADPDAISQRHAGPEHAERKNR